MSTTQSHLRTYLDDGIQQKVRLSDLIFSYQKQVFKSEERVANQTAFINELSAKETPIEKIQSAEKRKALDEKALTQSQSYLLAASELAGNLVPDLSVHLEELTELEMNANGFIEHPIGTGKAAALDKVNRILKLNANGHAEVLIGTPLTQWKDSCQLKITKIMKAGE